MGCDGVMIHLDLFSGIGGFAYAIDQVWDNVEHIFCDNDKFCQQVLNKHWKGSKVYGDIKEVIADTSSKGLEGSGRDKQTHPKHTRRSRVDLLTGGFPCQPFSQAGKRRGTEDNRYLWGEMFEVIRLTKPTWVIAENVRGLLTISGGLVFEQVCADLEAEGYEVQPFIIPAVSKDAQHRRDRVWVVAYALNDRQRQTKRQGNETSTRVSQEHRTQDSTARQFERTDSDRRTNEYDWSENWLKVATRVCRVDNGLPNRVDRLKALGNAIVPQVAVEIMKGIKASD